MPSSRKRAKGRARKATKAALSSNEDLSSEDYNESVTSDEASNESATNDNDANCK